MCNIYVVRTNESELLLASNVAEDNVRTVMRNYLRSINYHSYYMRCWMENGDVWYDYGNWAEFFVVRNVQ